MFGSVPRNAIYVLKIAAIGAFVFWTNSGFIDRVSLLLGHGRWVTLAGFVGVWAMTLLALLAAAFQSRLALRLGWAIIIAFSTAIGFAYRHASGSDFGVLDALSLWSARHEASRAAAFYTADLFWLAAVLTIGLVIFLIPPVPRVGIWRRWSGRTAWLPALPVALIAAIIVVKEGGGSEALPTQFEPLSVGLVLGTELASHPVPSRQAVAIDWRGLFTPAGATASSNERSAAIRHVVFIVDESVRADYLDWSPGNPYTPELASRKDKLVDFGPAASGGNCSHYSNSLLRFAARQDGINRSLLSIPTLWQYAKKAGFRTVYIDGQAGFNHNPGKLQNFMTAAEARDIDGFYALDESIPPSSLDDKLLDIVLSEMKRDEPVFIYANKNGAHFPYDEDYPAEAKLFRPTMSDSSNYTTATRIRSYRNAVRWSVDRIMSRLIDHAQTADTVVIYTSDHGQAFDPTRFTHCTTENPDPREGLVPMFVATGNSALRMRFAHAAQESHGHGSHFAIAPTVLDLLGYSEPEVAKLYGASLLDKSERKPEFTSGDIFGLFAAKTRWHPIDLGRDYLEPAARPQPGRPTVAIPAVQTRLPVTKG
jgi:lipid A ethanolaminephosphotransferase